MRRCLTRPTQTVDTQGDVWNHCVTNEVFNRVVDTQGDVWNHCVTNEEVFNRANTNSGYSG